MILQIKFYVKFGGAGEPGVLFRASGQAPLGKELYSKNMEDIKK